MKAQSHSLRGRVVLTYGTFDLFHIGHVNLLRRLKALGDQLVVAVSTDEFNRVKGKQTIIRFDDRIEIVRSCRYVDLAIPEMAWDQKLEDVRKYNVSVFGMGDDWSGRFDFLKPYCEVVYLPRTSNISSSALKELLRAAGGEQVEAMRAALKDISVILDGLGGAHAAPIACPRGQLADGDAAARAGSRPAEIAAMAM